MQVWSLSSDRCPGVGNGIPLQCFCLEKAHGQRTLVGYSPWGCKESNVTECARAHTHTYAHTHTHSVGNSLVVQWLGLHFHCRGQGFNPRWQTRSCMPHRENKTEEPPNHSVIPLKDPRSFRWFIACLGLDARAHLFCLLQLCPLGLRRKL